MKNVLKLMMYISLLLAGTANASFVGPYAVNNWTSVLDGGSIDISHAPHSVTLTSANTGSGVNSYQLFVNQATQNSVISFSWDYYTHDNDGSTYDPFGWFTVDINDPSSFSFNQLTEDSMYADPEDTESELINNHQYGQAFFNVFAGQIFGFYSQSTDSLAGSAITEITDFTASPAAVPVPAAIWLFGAPLFGLIGRKRKTKA